VYDTWLFSSDVTVYSSSATLQLQANR